MLYYLDPNHRDLSIAAREFGQLLHTVQDFYAHSNWVEQQGTLAYLDRGQGYWEPLLGIDKHYKMVKGAVLVEGEDVPEGYKLNPPRGKTFKVTTPYGEKKGIISGSTYFTDECPDKFAIGHWDDITSAGSDWPTSIRKIDPGYGTGLNKDDDTRPQYITARYWAKQQTFHEWCRLTSLVRKEYGDAAADFLMDNWTGSSSQSSFARSQINQNISIDPGPSCESFAEDQKELEEELEKKKFEKFPVIKVDMSISSSVINLKLANGPIQGSAKIVGEEIDKIKAKTGVNKVDIVGSGMGGLAAQHYGTYGSNFDVRKIVLIGTELHGADLEPIRKDRISK